MWSSGRTITSFARSGLVGRRRPGLPGDLRQHALRVRHSDGALKSVVDGIGRFWDRRSGLPGAGLRLGPDAVRTERQGSPDAVPARSRRRQASHRFLPPAARTSPHSAADAVAFLAQALDLHQLCPASRPAAWCAFGRPLTTTVVCADGPPWTIAPARFAASAASLAPGRQDAGEGQVHALQASQDAACVQPGGRCSQCLHQLVGAFVAPAALADAAVDDFFQMVAAGQRPHVSGAHPRSRASPRISMASSCPT